MQHTPYPSPMAALLPVALPPWAYTYLTLLEETGLERTSARGAGTTMRTVKALMDNNPEFKYAVEDALERSADTLEAEARRRAVEGVTKGVYYKGDRVDEEVVYSDALLTTLLKAKRPAQFGDRTQLVGPNNGPLQILVRQFGEPAPRPPIDGEATLVESEPYATLDADDLAGELPTAAASPDDLAGELPAHAAPPPHAAEPAPQVVLRTFGSPADDLL